MQAEILGIQLCCEQYEADTNGKYIFIMADSQAAIMALSKSYIDSKMVKNCANKLNALAILNKVTIVWVPAHSNHAGNEKADLLAKEGAAKEIIEVELTASPSIFERAIKSWLDAERKTEWRTRFPMRKQYAVNMISHISNDAARDMWNLTRSKIRAALSLLSGHSRLNRYRHWIDSSISPLCRFCEQEDEDVEHLIMLCDHLDDLRFRYFGRYTLDYHELEDYDLNCFIKFAKAANFYQVLECRRLPAH